MLLVVDVLLRGGALIFLFGKRVDCFISVLVPRQLWTHGKMKVYQKYPLIATIYILINWNTKQGKKKPLPLQI